MLHKSFKPAKCKTSLKLATSRIKLLKNKKAVQLKQLRREVAQLLESGNDQTARIRVEHVIREEKMVSAYDLIEIYCELIAARLAMIESQKNCPIDLKEAIASVIFASPRCADVPELLDICKHFTAKYGKEFKSAAVELRPDCGVNRMLVEKLSAMAPDGQTKIKILSAIAEEYNIKWDPKSFGERESKPSDDMLNGPKSFEQASVMLMGNVQNLHNDDQNHRQPVNNSVQSKRSSSGSQNFASADIGSTRTTAATSLPEVRPSEAQVENVEVTQSFSGDKDAFSMGGQKWNMEFMDATSAARAAAESAEQASMAARAAAELASRGKITRRSTKSQRTNDHVIKNEGPGEYDALRFPPEHLANNRVNNSLYDADLKLQNEQIYRNEHANPVGVSDAFYQGAHGNANRSSNEASLRSGRTSIDGDKLVNSLEEGGGYSKKGPSEYETVKSNEHLVFAKMNMSKTSVDDEAPVEGLKKVDRYSQNRLPEGEVVNAKENAFSSEINLKKQFGESDVGLVSGQQEKISDSIDYFGAEKIERHLNAASSRSRSNTIIGDYNVLNSNSQKFGRHADDPFMAANEVNIHRDSRPIISNDNAAVVFDESGSDDDESEFNVGSKYDMQESKLYFPSPGGQSPAYISANADSWSFGEATIGTVENSSSQSYVATEQSPSPDALRSLEKSSILSKPDNLPHFTSDDSDNPNPENGNELEKSTHGGTSHSVIHPEKQNIYPRNQVLAQSSGFSFADEGKSVFKGTQWSDYDDDSDSMKVQPRKNRGTELNADSHEKLSYVGLPASQQSTAHRISQLGVGNAGSDLPPCNPVDDGNFEDKKHATELSWKDDDFLSQPSSGSGKELNFGALTGGFRNKGHRLPSYTKIPSSDASSSSKNAAEDRPSAVEYSAASSTVDDSINSAINRKVNNKSNSRAPITHFDSDSDYSEEEIHQNTKKDKQEPYKQEEEKDIKSRPSLRAAVMYFDSDDGSSEEDLPRQTFTSRVRLGSGFSRRTKPSAFASSSHPKARIGSEALGNSDSTTERKLSKNSNDADTLPRPPSQAGSSGPSVGFEQSSSVELAGSKPMLESKMSSHRESLKPSSMEQSSGPFQKTVTSSSTWSAKTSTSKVETQSKENTIKRPSHIHPKLPDYDSIATQLESLRVSRQ